MPIVIRVRTLLITTLAFVLAMPTAVAQEDPVSDVDVQEVPVHNALETRFFVSAADLFATRNFNARARASVTPQTPRPYVDFESELGVGDSLEFFVGEFRWQFAQKWNLGLQYFQSGRAGRRTLERTVEWDDSVFDIGAEVRAETNVEITRIVVSRHFIQRGGHDLRLAGGVHWLDTSAEISGEATLDDGSTGFAASKASASLPIPNVGAAYQYSPSEKWLYGLRFDWFSASVGDYSGGIWNALANVNYQLGKHIGLGVGYQFFQLDGEVTDDSWRGDLKIRFDGPFVQLTGFW